MPSRSFFEVSCNNNKAFSMDHDGFVSFQQYFDLLQQRKSPEQVLEFGPISSRMSNITIMPSRLRMMLFELMVVLLENFDDQQTHSVITKHLKGRGAQPAEVSAFVKQFEIFQADFRSNGMRPN